MPFIIKSLHRRSAVPLPLGKGGIRGAPNDSKKGGISHLSTEIIQYSIFNVQCSIVCRIGPNHGILLNIGAGDAAFACGFKAEVGVYFHVYGLVRFKEWYRVLT